MKVRFCGAVIAEVISEEAHHYKIKNPDTGGITLVQKHICEIIEDKKEGTVKEKQYVVTQDILGIKADRIRVFIFHTADSDFLYNDKELRIASRHLESLLAQGIIAEKKSKAEEIVFNICQKYWQSTADDYRVKRLSDIILEELENAGIN